VPAAAAVEFDRVKAQQLVAVAVDCQWLAYSEAAPVSGVCL
jgi:hypothetical protein